MFWKKPKRSTKLKVILGMGLAILTVAIVSLISYRSLSDLVETINKASRPNRVVLVLKGVMSDLSDAESSVRAYTITDQPSYLTRYYNSITEIEEKMEKLEDLTYRDSLQRARVDSIGSLIEQKYVTLEKLLHINSDGEELDNTLDRVSENIDEAKENLPDEKFETKKGDTADDAEGFLRKLFKRKREQNEAEMTEEEKKEEEERAIKDIEDAVAALKKRHRKQLKLRKERELELTKKDERIMDKIRGVIEAMEKEEIVRSQMKADKVSRNADLTKTIITVFSTIAFILLLFLGYFIIKDVTRSNRFRKILSNAKARAEKLARVKDEFLANMSHEIRTPITAIVGFTEQLKKTELDRDQTKYVKVIRNSSEHLLAIINDVLDHSKLESDTLKFEQVPFRIEDAMDDVLMSFEEKANEKGIELRKEMGDEVPAVLKGDPVRLKQILINLVGNALKFTDEGYVKVGCHEEGKEDDRMMIRMEVEDTGVGIPENKRELIFKNFSQADTSTTRKYGGSGLGLSITKRLVELQKGKLTVDSQEGKGSTFTFIIPYEVGEEKELRSVEEKSEQINISGLAGKKALVVDDEQYNRMLIKTVLQKWDMDVRDVGDGRSAFEEVEKDPPDIVLMDIQMPEVSGIEVTRWLKNSEKGKTVPVIALTAGISRQEIEKSYEAGMVGHLLKPFKEDELYNKLIKTFPDVVRSEQGAKSQKVNEKEKNENGSKKKEKALTDLKKLYDLAEGDKGFVRDMLETFIRDSQDTMNDIQKGIANNDPKEVGAKAHKLASPCRHLGMSSIAKDLKTIEKHCKEQDEIEGIRQLVKDCVERMDKALIEVKEEKERLVHQ